MNLLVSTILVFLFFILLTFYSKLEIRESFVISSIVSTTNYLGVHNISTIIIFFGLILLLTKFDFSLKKFNLFFIFIVVVIFGLYFSFSYNERYIYFFGKSLKVVILLSPLLFISMKSDFFNERQIKKYVDVSLFCHVFSGVVWLLIGEFDRGLLGLPRFSGISTDANYAAFFMILSLYICLNYNLGLIRTSIVFICIIATQSVTAITFMFILIFWSYLGFNSKILKKISIISLILIVFSYVYIIHLGPSVDIKSGWETSAIDRKLNSFIFRVQPQINAMEMISTSERYYSGFGSGQSLVYFSRPFHNSYMQLIFDHGYIISCVLVFAVFFYSMSIGHWPAFFSLLLSSLLFEHFFMMTVILYFFILRRCSIT